LKPGDRWRVALYIMNEFKGGLGAASAAAPAAADNTAVTETTETAASTQPQNNK